MQGPMSHCTLCPRRCGANRVQGHTGYCRSGILPAVPSACVHHGEEPVLSGSRGAGTIFFAGCNLKCIYCQNHQISQDTDPAKSEITPEALVGRILWLQGKGCHNIEFVTPSHFTSQMADAVIEARRQGLKLPVAYNTSAYDCVDTLQALEDVVDIYLPDIKYSFDSAAARLSDAPDYVSVSRRAIREMWRQKGRLVLDAGGVATRGVLVRHLALPGDPGGTRECIRFLAEEISCDISVSLMSQYYPAHRVARTGGSDCAMFQELYRPLLAKEQESARAALDEFGIVNGFVQDRSSEKHFRPDFYRSTPAFTPASAPGIIQGDVTR